MPFSKIFEWLNKEKALGVSEPEAAILSSVSNNTPHSRVVAIREIKDDSLIFFTSSQTKKVGELLNNSSSTMTFWFSMQKRQIILEGITEPLSSEESKNYWNELPRERQLRFSTYAPFSGQEIDNLMDLQDIKETLEKDFVDQSIPMSEFYMGFRFLPSKIIFYTTASTSFSEVIQFKKIKGDWTKQLLSP